METLSSASKERLQVSKSLRYSKVLDSMIAKTNYQIEVLPKRFHQHSPKTRTDPLKSLRNPLTKMEINMRNKTQETCSPVGHCLGSNSPAEICHTHILRRHQSSYNLVYLIHKNTARSKYNNCGIKSLPRSSLAIHRKMNM